MEDLMRDVLTAAGVAIEPQHVSTISTAWKNWLNLDDCDDSQASSIEQTAPLATSVYQALCSLFIYAWRNVNVVQLNLTHDNKNATLDDQVEAVRVTGWLRHIMDLHVDDRASFSELLLVHTLEAGPHNVDELLGALYHHVASLPYLQQQIHYQAQSLRQETQASAKNQTVHSRLEQYQEVQATSERLLEELERHVNKLEYVLGEWYAVGSVHVRKLCRFHLGTVWHDFVKTSHRPSTQRMENTSATSISMTLRVLLRILQGRSTIIITPAHRHLLFHQLIPLHQPSTMVLWRDQTCLLELYHEPLVQCTAILLKRQPEWIPPAIESLLHPNVLPQSGNTPKVVLILYEIDMYIGLSCAKASEWSSTLANVKVFRALLQKLAICIASDNSRMSEQALQFFRNVNFCQCAFDDYDASMAILLPALARNDVPWNPTVCKMTHTVLVQCQSHDEQKFAAAAERAFGKDSSVNVSPLQSRKDDTSSSMDVELEESTAATMPPPPPPSPSSSRFSLKAGMGDWRPPPLPRGRHHSMLPPKSQPCAKTPPLTITGVAPWAETATRVAPPLTITGVAPWANEFTFGQKRSAEKAQLSEQSPPPHPSPIAEEAKDDDDDDEQIGLKRVLHYMSQLKPAEDGSGDDDGTSPWAKAQMSETPTLLPSLKFHDLVFGHDLGSGAFGVVKYARQIDKSTTRSHWAEYAVKIISTQRIQEMGYETSVQREIASLRIMSHPCIARLISSFRFGDGAYLVLEYASGGDLHSLLQKQGSLDQLSTKFVIGEIASALASIHDLGFVYGDLKPENALITETGHMKLTDFGACRPVTLSAEELIRPSGQHLLKELRDGDWKERPNTQEDDVEMKEVGSSAEDLWIEGTTAYLPPEVVLGQVPTIAADAWALGCVMYQCLSGRPPLLDIDEHATKHKIVTFHMDHDDVDDDGDPLFRHAHSADITPEARALIRKLLSQENRPSMVQVAQDDFFSGTDIFSLHRQPAVPLDVGTVAPVEDAQWSRRQYSSIWAPQPKAYDISIPQPMHFANPLLSSKAPIPEGDEANCFFSWSRQVS